jgi:cytochrome oxidase Cu insertion factor (SCO1/SenC/PrrC family)
MRKIILSIGAVLMAFVLNAQTSLTTAIDFTVTDTQGNQHHLFDYLNDGKYVVLDFFFTT